MTKQELTIAILNDMYAKNDSSKASIDKRWKGWLTRQSKADLETIYTNRKIGK